jgi:hypothetical protein
MNSTKEFTSYGWIDESIRAAHLYGVTVCMDTPITGVISNNEIIDFIGEEQYVGIDLGWEDWLADFESEHGREPDDHEKQWFAESCDESGPYLIGDWKKEDGLWEVNKDGPNGYSAIIRSDVTQVCYSKHTTLAAPCSPCYPGQGDVGTDGPFLTYTLERDCFDSVSTITFKR